MSLPNTHDEGAHLLASIRAWNIPCKYLSAMEASIKIIATLRKFVLFSVAHRRAERLRYTT